ncbi:hypothetical protein THAOC_37770, partial [Thalassiosira oceanica]
MKDDGPIGLMMAPLRYANGPAEEYLPVQPLALRLHYRARELRPRRAQSPVIDVIEASRADDSSISRQPPTAFINGAMDNKETRHEPAWRLEACGNTHRPQSTVDEYIEQQVRQTATSTAFPASRNDKLRVSPRRAEEPPDWAREAAGRAKGEEGRRSEEEAAPNTNGFHLARGRNAAEMLKITAVVHSVLSPDV